MERSSTSRRWSWATVSSSTIRPLSSAGRSRSSRSGARARVRRATLVVLRSRSSALLRATVSSQGGWVVRHAPLRPPRHGLDQRLLHRLVGEVEVTEPSDEDPWSPGRPRHGQPGDRVGGVRVRPASARTITGWTSTPACGAGHLAGTVGASSRSDAFDHGRSRRPAPWSRCTALGHGLTPPSPAMVVLYAVAGAGDPVPAVDQPLVAGSQAAIPPTGVRGRGVPRRHLGLVDGDEEQVLHDVSPRFRTGSLPSCCTHDARRRRNRHRPPRGSSGRLGP